MASSGSRSGGSSSREKKVNNARDMFWVDPETSIHYQSKDEMMEARLSKKKEQRVIGTGSQPTPPPAHAANKQKKEYSKKTGPGHEAKGAGGDGGGDDGGRDGGHDDGKPKKGFTFCLICREYIRSGRIFDEHVRLMHPAA